MDQAGIGLGQQGEAVHNLAQPAQFFELAGSVFTLRGCQRFIAQFHLRLTAKDGQGRLELVRSMQRELADAYEGIVQAPRHGIEDLGQPVKFIAVAGAGQLCAQVMLVAALRRVGEPGNGRQRPAGEPPAAGEPQYHRRQAHLAEQLAGFLQRVPDRSVLVVLVELFNQFMVGPAADNQQGHGQHSRVPQVQAGTDGHGSSFSM